MKLFTVGPVQMYPETLQIEGTQLPYFRTQEFGQLMLECEDWFLTSIHAPKDSAFIALTCSGTGAMDAAVMNTLTAKDKVLVIDGGSFGHRFTQICSSYNISTETYDIPFQKAFSKEEFAKYEGKNFTALLVNACETSTGQLYDLDYLGEFCRRNHMLFIVDAVSAYLADPIDMEKQGIDVLITASQKALALSPGVSLVALSTRAKTSLNECNPSYYFDFKSYIENQKRGQPPFTSAVGTMLALHQRLKSIQEKGVSNENILHAERATYFRDRLDGLLKLSEELSGITQNAAHCITIPDIPLSNSCTPVIFPNKNATAVYESLKDKYEIYLTPSGGDLKDLQLRVGHLGNLTLKDYDVLLEKLKEELTK